MELRRTRELLPEVIWRERSPSTNAELRQLVGGGTQSDGAGAPTADGERIAPGGPLPHRAPLPHGTLLATADQTAGRGRQGRGGVTPPHTSVAASLLVRGFERSLLGPGWLPLLAGAAVAAALQPRYFAGMRVGVKWPNDVHVRDEGDAVAGRPGLKLCGILCELLGDGSVIVGTGLNLLIPEWELPTERATSLLASGADVGGARTLEDAAGRDLVDGVLATYASEMLHLVELAVDEPDAARARVVRSSVTIGSDVRVHLPGGRLVDGHARRLAEDGSLVVDLPTGGSLTVSAGDVEHLRAR